MATLMFLTVLFVAGLAAWLIDSLMVREVETVEWVAAAVVAGLGAGAFLSGWLA